MSSLTSPEKGYCQCGCGQKTAIAQKTRTNIGHIKGQPKTYINGHNRRKEIQYIEEERGYTTPCWTWQLGKTIWGYGTTCENGRSKAAHRVYYKRVHPSLPDNRHLDHLCRNRDCVNPDHLEPVTHAENIQRGRLAKLSPYTAFTIRLMAATTSVRRVDLAEMFGVSPATVFAVLRGSVWRNYM